MLYAIYPVSKEDERSRLLCSCGKQSLPVKMTNSSQRKNPHNPYFYTIPIFKGGIALWLSKQKPIRQLPPVN